MKTGLTLFVGVVLGIALTIILIDESDVVPNIMKSGPTKQRRMLAIAGS